MQRIVIASLLFTSTCLLGGCLSSNGTGWHVSEDEPQPESVAPAPDPAELEVAAPRPVRTEPFVVHEWGTYTSLQGSDGQVQNGMHYEEEALPAFVHDRLPPAPASQRQIPGQKAFELPIEGVTQKLETPVIYFYGAPSRVDVTVDFPRGVISQWYPEATSWAPAAYEAQFDTNDIVNGTMSWSLDVLPRGETAGMIDVPEDDIWAPSRNVDAQPVRIGDEVEKFIFYRGLGRFETPFRVTSQGEVLTIHNPSDEVVPDVYVLHWNGERGAAHALGSLDAKASTTFSPTPKELPQPDYLEQAREMVVDGLVRSGLTEDESWAMVDTWNRSYFKTEGLRVLYVAPRAWTDELLPITVEPKPDELVRTLIGRVEVMTEADERELLARLEARELSVEDAGRFGEPRLQRALELATNPGVREQLELMIGSLRERGYSPEN